MKDILTRLFNHEELTSEETKQILLNITREAYPEAQISALLTVFQMRSITVDELIGFREALMETRIPIDFAPYRPIDIVGTGGDGKNTFNISTCACFVVAGAGYKVAKHGNYGATSVSGASNVMEQHGIRFTNDPDKLKRIPARPTFQSGNEVRRPCAQGIGSTYTVQPSWPACQSLQAYLPVARCGRSCTDATLHKCFLQTRHRFCGSQQSR